MLGGFARELARDKPISERRKEGHPPSGVWVGAWAGELTGLGSELYQWVGYHTRRRTPLRA
jgi:hypothetical protein